MTGEGNENGVPSGDIGLRNGLKEQVGGGEVTEASIGGDEGAGGVVVEEGAGEEHESVDFGEGLGIFGVLQEGLQPSMAGESSEHFICSK